VVYSSLSYYINGDIIKGTADNLLIKLKERYLAYGIGNWMGVY